MLNAAYRTKMCTAYPHIRFPRNRVLVSVMNKPLQISLVKNKPFDNYLIGIKPALNVFCMPYTRSDAMEMYGPNLVCNGAMVCRLVNKI